MKPPVDCRQGQKAVCVKEETPEHSPPLQGGANSPSEPANPKTPVQLVYLSHRVYLGDHTYMTAESPTELHIKEEPEETSLVYDVKEEAPCADEGVLQSSDLQGVSAAAMLASLYTDHVVKDELVLGPDLPHRPSVTPVFCEKEPTVKSEMEAEAGSSNGLVMYEQSSIKIKIKDKDDACEEEKQDMLLNIKEEQEFRTDEVVHVKEEPSVPCSVTEGEGCSGVSEAAMRAGLYADHIIKDELVLGPERPHRPTLLSSPPGHVVSSDAGVAEALGRRCSVRPERLLLDAGVAEALGRRCSVRLERLLLDAGVAEALGRRCSVRLERLLLDAGVAEALGRRCSWPERLLLDAGVAEALGRRCSVRPERLLLDAGVAEALGRRCSVRLERLLLDAERRACRVGRRTYRLRPESEPRRAATPATDTYRCDHCDKAFRHKSVLSKHIHTHLSTRLARSRYSTREDSNLDRQQKLDTRTKPFKCSLKGNLQRLKSTHLGTKPFHCNYCDYKCSQRSHLKSHEMIHTGEKPFQCGYCDYKCSRKESLRSHEMTHTEEKPFQCYYCDYKCRRKGHLTNHEMTHTGEHFQCYCCDYKCMRKGNLRRHEMTHTGEKPFQCYSCDYKCIRKGNLRRHEMTHTGAKPFQCKFCDYKCRYKNSLRDHEMTHTGLKPFQCDYCDHKFSRKWDLRKHVMTHTGVKPFQCDYCDHKCIRKWDLRNHVMTHTGLKPFHCKYCDYVCSRNANLWKHELTHIAIEPVPESSCNNDNNTSTVRII